MADRKISDLTALTTPASGDFLPIVDISEAAAASKNKRITIAKLMRGMPNGTAAAPSIAFETDLNTGIFSPGADQVAISTNGTNRLHITSAGLVGIGTAAPAELVDVRAAVTANIRLGSTATAQNNNSVIGALEFFNSDANQDAVAARIQAVRGSGFGAGGLLTFSTSAAGLTAGPLTEQMRIGNDGTITLSAYGAGTLSTSASGVISASDARYKTKTRQLESGLNVIAALQPTYYRWNEGSPFKSEHEELGFVAQEVAAVIPEASPGEDEEGKYRNYHDRAIIAMLVKGMQEQQSIITALTARVAALEAN